MQRGVAGLPDVFSTATVTHLETTSLISLSGVLGTLNNTSPPTLVSGGVGNKISYLFQISLISEAETLQVMKNIKYSLEVTLKPLSPIFEVHLPQFPPDRECVSR